MPELPEVETLKNSLAPILEQANIRSCQLIRTDILSYQDVDGLKPMSLDQACCLFNNQQILSLYRRGKYILIECKSGWLVAHMRMTGKLLIFPGALTPQSSDLPKHTHVLFHLEKTIHSQIHRYTLAFNDVRRFGSLIWISGRQPPDTILPDLGIEPLSADFNGNYLYRQSRRHAQLKVKSLLLNQTVIAGLGNIYADEVLFAGRVHPLRLSKSLRQWECDDLVIQIKRILQAAIDAGGTSFRDYMDANQKRGRYLLKLNVYGRSGQGCKHCGHALKKVTVGGRSTVYCPHCQPRRPMPKSAYQKKG